MALTPVPMNDIPKNLIPVPTSDIPQNLVPVPSQDIPSKPTLGQRIAQGAKQQVAGRGVGQYLKEEAQQTFAPMVGVLGGIGKVAESTAGAGMDWLGKKLFGESYGTVGGTTEKIVPKILQGQEQGVGYKIGEVIGKNVPSTLATSGLGAIGGATKATRFLKNAPVGAVSTTLNTLLTEKRMPTATELAIGAGTQGFGAGIFGKATKGQYEKLVQPKMTPSEETARASQGLKTTNIFGKVKILSNKAEKQMAKIAGDIGLKPGNNNVDNINKAIKTEGQESDKLRKLVKDNPYTFNTKTVASNIDKIETPISIKGDKVMEAKFNNVKKAFIDIRETQPKKNAEGMLEARKQFDSLVKREFPNLYTSDTLTPIKSVITAIRQVPNKLINDKIGGNVVKQSLDKQTNIMGIIENLSTKSEKGGTTALGRFLNDTQAGKLVKRIGGTLLLGGAGALGYKAMQGKGGGTYSPE